MRRRIPLLLACLCIITVFAALAYLINESVVLRGVNAIETSQAENDMNQLRSYLRMAELRMHQHMLDWALWDEAYQFMDDHNSAFIDNNFDLSLLNELHLSGAAFYDLSGTPVAFVDGTDLLHGAAWVEEEQRVFRQLAEKLLRGGLESLEGYITVGGKGMVVAAHRVFDGNKLKPPKGLLIMSSLLDKDFIEDAEKITQLHFSVLPVAAYSAVQTTAALGTGYKILQLPDAIRVYSIIYDVFGNSAFCLELQRNRLIAALGRQISQKNFLLILGLGVVILVAGLALLQHAQRRFIRDEMAYRAGHDSLTGLPNKGLFLERLRETAETVQKEKTCLGVLFIDLDRFKAANDSYGHAQGDNLLREAAERLQARFTGGCVARPGGDAFLVAIAAANKNQIEAQARNILASLSKPFVIKGDKLHLGASIGVALFPGDGENAETLVHRAELAMYDAKEKGRNTVSFFVEAMDVAASRKMEMETALYRAVDEETLTVHYQPKINVATTDVAGCEALVRWQTGDGKWVPPPAFIPLAEEIGLVERIDMFVLRSACRQVNAWARDGSGAVPVAVNMSARSILSEGFADKVIRTLQEEGTPPSLIDVEITETSIMTDLDTANAAIARLHEAGIRIALDDFGTGYSSMQFLYSMPIACLKIDKRFIDGIAAANGDSKALVKGMLALASNLGMDTVAEGVEDLGQLSFLSANHCNIIQGYLFSRPLNGADCGEFLRNRRARIVAVSGSVPVQ